METCATPFCKSPPTHTVVLPTIEYHQCEPHTREMFNNLKKANRYAYVIMARLPKELKV